MHRYLWLLALPLALPCYGQFLSAGVKVGVGLTNAFSSAVSNATTYDRRYIIGPTIEVRLPFHFSFEADALYRRYGFDFGGVTRTGPFSSHTPVNDWQFPFLAKYDVSSGRIRPFIDAGVVFRHVSPSGTFGFPNHPNGAGFAVGGGLTLRPPLLHISPEVRYTHWFSPPFNLGYSVVQSTSNQVDFLVGLTI